MSALLNLLERTSFTFSEVIEAIDTEFAFTPTAFKNGETHNNADSNNGSCKVFSAAKQLQLSKEDTLKLFAEHYQSVLNTPEGTDHLNIRNFIAHGWDGIAFEGNALSKRA